MLREQLRYPSSRFFHTLCKRILSFRRQRITRHDQNYARHRFRKECIATEAHPVRCLLLMLSLSAWGNAPWVVHMSTAMLSFHIVEFATRPCAHLAGQPGGTRSNLNLTFLGSCMSSDLHSVERAAGSAKVPSPRRFNHRIYP